MKLDPVTVKRIQERCGLPADQRDGALGKQTLAAIDTTLADVERYMARQPGVTKPARRLDGDRTWPWYAEIDEEDIVIRGATVTAFGGTADKMDSGETASGFSTAQNPQFLGCALPLRRDLLRDRKHGFVLRGSPIPSTVPWMTKVIFSDPKGGMAVTTDLIDLGPAKWTGNAGDLTVAAARLFSGNATANSFKRILDIRIVGAARYAR